MVKGRTGIVEMHWRNYIEFNYRGKTKLAEIIELDGKRYALVNYTLKVYEVKTINGQDVELHPIKSKMTIDRVVKEAEEKLQSEFSHQLLRSE